MAVNKQSFYECINKDTVFNDEFFRKVYAYSVCDNLFLGAVASSLINLDMYEKVQAYNEWYAAWKAQDDLKMKKVAEWYHKECDKQFDKWQKEHGKAVDEWKTVKTWDAIAKALNYR